MNMNNPLLNQLQQSTGGKNLMDQMAQIQGMQDSIRKPSRRDHQASLDDDSMAVTMAMSWPAWDQFLQTVQRDMAKLPKTELDRENLAAVYFTIGQIMDRALEVIDKGNQIRVAQQTAQQAAQSVVRAQDLNNGGVTQP